MSKALRVIALVVGVSLMMLGTACSEEKEEIPPGMAQIEIDGFVTTVVIPDIHAKLDWGFWPPHPRRLNVPPGKHLVMVGSRDDEASVIFIMLFVKGHRYEFKEAVEIEGPCRLFHLDPCTEYAVFWVEDAADRSVVAGKRPSKKDDVISGSNY